MSKESEDVVTRIESLEARVTKLEKEVRQEQFPEVMNKTTALKYLFGYKNYFLWNLWMSRGLIIEKVENGRVFYLKRSLNRVLEIVETENIKYRD